MVSRVVNRTHIAIGTVVVKAHHILIVVQFNHQLFGSSLSRGSQFYGITPDGVMRQVEIEYVARNTGFSDFLFLTVYFIGIQNFACKFQVHSGLIVSGQFIDPDNQVVVLLRFFQGHQTNFRGING